MDTIGILAGLFLTMAVGAALALNLNVPTATRRAWFLGAVATFAVVGIVASLV